MEVCAASLEYGYLFSEDVEVCGGFVDFGFGDNCVSFIDDPGIGRLLLSQPGHFILEPGQLCIGIVSLLRTGVDLSVKLLT